MIMANDDKAQAAGQQAPPAPACTLVIFGAHGDLTKRLLMPALYNLAEMGLLDGGMKILGVDHLDNDTKSWVDDLTATMQSFTQNKTGEFHPDKIEPGPWNWVTQRLEYIKGDFGDAETFKSLAGRLSGNCLFYLAVAARFFGPLVEQIGGAGLFKESDGAFRRVLIEKPFGEDLASAEALNARILKVVDERQVYRIDHFMGKETVQNILPFRFSNSQFEPIWRREYIDYVEITAAETVGVELRGAFYEPTGALRDMVPNHLFTILAMVAMEPPDTYSSDAIRTEKARVIQAIKPIPPQDAVRGQYTAGTVLGKPAQAYRAEPDVAHDSGTETYIALKVSIENWRWAGVPFYVRTGKYMSGRRTEVVIHFKHPPLTLLQGTDAAPPRSALTIGLDPVAQTVLKINVKTPGVLTTLAPVEMVFRYADNFPQPSRVGYEGLFYGAMQGETTLFQRADNIEAGWAAVDQALKAPPPVQMYRAGSAGPDEADKLLARDGHAWTKLD
jgi:glucose-6-phosphate 1-dehydrogenase